MPSQKQDPRLSLRATVRACLLTAKGGRSKTPQYRLSSHIEKEQIFRDWYVAHGKAYFFLFKKNLKVTNVQFAELHALIRVHSIERDVIARQLDENLPRDLQFISSPDFHVFVDKMLQPFIRTHTSGEVSAESLGELDSLIDHYARIFLNLIVFDSYFGSCVVYMPPTLDLDLKAICAYSGYVHSCGVRVYVGKVNETEPEHLERAITKALAKRKTTRSIRLFVFAHEEFSKGDRGWEEELKYGLDDVKFYEQKFHLGREPLIRVLQRISARNTKIRVILSRPGLARKLRGPQTFDKTCSLWLIGDRSISKDITKPGDDRFLMCYEQKFKNCNPTHIFEENKPAWVSQTTIPHPLMAAMINITKPWWRKKGTILCADPFAGSGTTWFESEKHPRIICRSSDISSVSSILIQDNCDFLSAKPAELVRIISKLNNLTKQVKTLSPASPNNIVSSFPDRVRKLIQEHRRSERNLVDARQKALVPKSLLSLDSDSVQLRCLSLEERLILYLALRSQVRHALGFESGRESWGKAFVDEAEKLKFQFKALLKLRRCKLRSPNSDQISVITGKFSDGCLIWPERFERLSGKYPSGLATFREDVSAIHDGVFDLIATDPPYGFNEDMGFQKLAQLHSSLFGHLIRALRDEGQIVIAVPDASLIGKAFPEFTTKHTVIRQILLAARQEGREVFRTAYSVPSPGELFEPPYYWDSGGSLTRAILHFRFRRSAA
jgi:hypothetical protein